MLLATNCLQCKSDFIYNYTHHPKRLFCDLCRKIRAREFIRAFKKTEKGKLAMSLWQKTPKGRESIRRRVARYQSTEKGKAHLKANYEKYKQLGILKLHRKIWRAKHRAKYKAQGSFTKKEWLAKLQEYNHNCGICLNPLGNDITVDHIIPISRQGLNTIDNIQPAHMLCNQKKNNCLNYTGKKAEKLQG